MYWYRICLNVVLSLCLLCLFCPTAVAQSAVSVQSTAGSAILYEPTSGRVLFEKHAHIKRPMASTTKLMTALLAVERLSAQEPITASSDALNVIGTRMGLQAGETATRDDLLKGLLLSSGNDAANVLALAMAPGFEAFSELMNARASAIGMTESHFVTPSGLDAPGHASTAYDMALLAARVLEEETLAAICLQKTATVTVGERTLTLTNHNKLLSLYPDAIGMKTGYTSAAGRCLVSAAKRDGVTLIAVTLDCRNDWQEHMTMLDEGFSLMASTTVTPSIPQTVAVFGGQKDTLPIASTPVPITLLKEDSDKLSYTVRLMPYIWAPVEKGATIGRVDYLLQGDVLKSIPITAEQSVQAVSSVSFFEKTMWYFRYLVYELTVGT